METILIALLCMIVGILSSIMGIGYFKRKRKEKNKKNNVKLVKKLPMEFSKKILYAMFSLTLVIIVCAIGMSYVTQTTDVYAYLIPSIFLELSVGTLFYYKKAEKENLLRESNRHELEMSETSKDFNNEEEDVV